jgi:hypothetical protein
MSHGTKPSTTGISSPQFYGPKYKNIVEYQMRDIIKETVNFVFLHTKHRLNSKFLITDVLLLFVDL